MGRATEFFKRYRWALLSGFLMGSSYIPFPPWALFFCWVPLWIDLFTQTKTPREAFIKAWWAQFVLSLIGFHWISFVAHEFGFLPWPVAIVVLLVFAAAVHLYIPLAAALAVSLRNRFGLSAGAVFVLLAVFHNLGECYWPSVFAWNFGYPLLWIHSPWAQWADVVGFLGLSFFMHLINALVAWLWLRKDRRRAAAWIGATAVLLAAAWFFGEARQKRWEHDADRSIKALIIQANIGNLEKYYAERGAGYQRQIIQKNLDLSRLGLAQHPDAELLIWPESAIPEFLDEHNRFRRYSPLFFDGIRQLQRSVLTGAYSNDPPFSQLRDDYNSMFLFGSQGESLAVPYHKTYLLMFGEYVPFGSVFPILRKWNPGGAGFGRGTGPTVFQWGEWKIGPQICYESLEPHFAGKSVLLGADFLVNITNDSWFGPRSEPDQHLYMTLARAIETRRPLLRGTNTGISTAIEASGRIHAQSPKGAEWTGLYDVKLQKNAPLTFYTQYGAFLPLIPALVVGIILWRSRRGASRLA